MQISRVFLSALQIALHLYPDPRSSVLIRGKALPLRSRRSLPPPHLFVFPLKTKGQVPVDPSVTHASPRGHPGVSQGARLGDPIPIPTQSQPAEGRKTAQNTNRNGFPVAQL